MPGSKAYGDAQRTFIYDDATSEVVEADARGHTTRRTVDGLHREIQVNDALR